MPPAEPLHATIVQFVFRYLMATIEGPTAVVRFEQPVRLDNQNELVPDVVLVRSVSDNYMNVHPTPSEVQLAIEVADSSLDRDLGVKSRLYGSAGIAEYWVIDANARCVHRFTGPSSTGYSSEQVLDERAGLNFGSTPIQVARFFKPA